VRCAACAPTTHREGPASQPNEVLYLTKSTAFHALAAKRPRSDSFSSAPAGFGSSCVTGPRSAASGSQTGMARQMAAWSLRLVPGGIRCDPLDVMCVQTAACRYSTGRLVVWDRRKKRSGRCASRRCQAPRRRNREMVQGRRQAGRHRAGPLAAQGYGLFQGCLPPLWRWKLGRMWIGDRQAGSQGAERRQARKTAAAARVWRLESAGTAH